MKPLLSDQAIPDLPSHDWGVVRNIAIRESDEPLVEIQDAPRLKQDPIYFRHQIPYAINHCFVRQRIVDKLHDAVALLPENLGIVVLDAWRPRAVQRALLDQVGDVIKKTYPDLDDAAFQTMLSKFVAPAAADFISPHLTGGSVDVSLYDRVTGDYLDMGSAFDEPTDASFTSAYESQSQHAAHTHRRLLYNAMTKAGFTNITSEWWHYDYGNQLWAFYHAKDFAIYGEAKPSA